MNPVFQIYYTVEKLFEDYIANKLDKQKRGYPSPMAGRHVGEKALGYAQYYARHEKSGGSPADPIAVLWTVYDLRRTAATRLAKLGCPRVVQDRVLNHVDGSVSAIYDRHRYDEEAREWLQKWADKLDALKVHNVIPLEHA